MCKCMRSVDTVRWRFCRFIVDDKYDEKRILVHTYYILTYLIITILQRSAYSTLATKLDISCS